MMEIVKNWLMVVAHPRPMVTTMVCLCAEHGKDHPQVHGEDVRIGDDCTTEQRPNIRQEHLERMAVGCNKRHRCSVLVVPLVDLAVKHLGMQPTVSVVEKNLIGENVDRIMAAHF